MTQFTAAKPSLQVFRAQSNLSLLLLETLGWGKRRFGLDLSILALSGRRLCSHLGEDRDSSNLLDRLLYVPPVGEVGVGRDIICRLGDGRSGIYREFLLGVSRQWRGHTHARAEEFRAHPGRWHARPGRVQ